MQCDSWAYSLQLWAEGPGHGSGHSLFLIPGHAACGSQQLERPPVHPSQHQRCQSHPDAPHSCNVPVGRHAVSRWQVRVLAGMQSLDAIIFGTSLIEFTHVCMLNLLLPISNACQAVSALIVCMPAKSSLQACVSAQPKPSQHYQLSANVSDCIRV